MIRKTPWLAVLGFVLVSSPVHAPAASARAFDWCSGIVSSPDQRWKDPRACVPFFSDEELVAGAEVLLIGEFTDVAEPKIPSPGRACEPNPTHATSAAFEKRLREARAAAGGPPIFFVHQHRFDLVSAQLAAQPGFDPAFLVRSARPFEEVEGFFAKESGAPCEGACRLSASWPNLEGKDAGRRLRDYIDAKAGEGAWRSAVYYLARPQGNSNVFGVTAAIADLGNAEYRAWRVAEAKKAFEVGGYDAIALNHKFHQYRDGAKHWIGGPEVPDVAALRATGDTYWTAPPASYGYGEYVAGWSALARELREAGVPYTVTLNAAHFTGDVFDDRSTPQNEAELIRKAAEGARLVMIDRGGGNPAQPVLDAMVRRLEAKGPRVVVFDQRCGLAK